MALVLSAATLALPVWAAPGSPASAPLGVVLQADKATVGADTTSGGATIYDGDRLSTGGSGALRVRFGGAEMFLRANSLTTVHNFPNGFAANLAQGTVVASSSQGQTFQVLADGAAIRPANSKPAAAEVTYVSPTQLLLTASRGTVEVVLGDEVKTVEAGNSYRVDVAPEDAPASPQGPYHTGHSHRLALILIGGGVAVGTGVGIWRALVSPSAP
jgi:hypothetical protein